jgi:hypothetical protein
MKAGSAPDAARQPTVTRVGCGPRGAGVETGSAWRSRCIWWSSRINWDRRARVSRTTRRSPIKHAQSRATDSAIAAKPCPVILAIGIQSFPSWQTNSNPPTSVRLHLLSSGFPFVQVRCVAWHTTSDTTPPPPGAANSTTLSATATSQMFTLGRDARQGRLSMRSVSLAHDRPIRAATVRERSSNGIESSGCGPSDTPGNGNSGRDRPHNWPCPGSICRRYGR